jgi:hypothetical protein
MQATDADYLAILALEPLMMANLNAVFILVSCVHSYMGETEYTTLTVRQADKAVFKQALDAVAVELGEEPTHSDALREISEAYTGNNALGEWKHD